MRYNKIRKMDISNGPGIRVSIFLQGCTFNCKNCFNPETHDFNGGKEFTEETVEKVMDLCEKDYVEGLSILGGEPMHPKNIEATRMLSEEFKKRYPKQSVWVWTGYNVEKLLNKEALKYIDVLVDGLFMDELHDPTLYFRGSSNQRLIDVKKTLKKGEVVILKETKDKITI